MELVQQQQQQHEVQRQQQHGLHYLEQQDRLN
jgi:hypothetical protein